MVYYPIKILNTAPICSPLLKSPEDMWDVNIFLVPLNKRCLLLMLVYAGRWTNHPCSSAPCNQILLRNVKKGDRSDRAYVYRNMISVVYLIVARQQR